MLSIKTRVISIPFILLVCHVASGQMPTTPIHALTDSVRLHPKPSLILISTGWCSYCQMQKAQLKKNADFQAASAYFYFSELDAEAKEDITFNGRTYIFQHTGVGIGMHELAYALGNIDQRLALPTWVLVDADFNIRFKYPGVLNKKTLTKLVENLREPR